MPIEYLHAGHGDDEEAAAVVGITSTTAYQRRRRRDAGFAAAMDWATATRITPEPAGAATDARSGPLSTNTSPPMACSGRRFSPR
ncbi:hypothetical protein ACIA98_36085 [Streptomyces sp. NPDC051366]|uniref:hypothetical protein n=1 Tax=Streptomyces sp. NPDC051366 TaxID=3365652 RepID=UPI003795FF13